jgi:hypothetical protein
MIYFGYPLDIHGWKTKIKTETEPDWFRGPNPKTVGEKSSPNPNPQDSKPKDIRLETVPLSSLRIPRVMDSTAVASGPWTRTWRNRRSQDCRGSCSLQSGPFVGKIDGKLNKIICKSLAYPDFKLWLRMAYADASNKTSRGSHHWQILHEIFFRNYNPTSINWDLISLKILKLNKEPKGRALPI